MRGDPEAGDGRHGVGSSARGERSDGWLKRYVPISLVVRCRMLGIELLKGGIGVMRRGGDLDGEGGRERGRSADSCLGLGQEERALAAEPG